MATQAAAGPYPVKPSASDTVRRARPRTKIPVFNPSDWPDDPQVGGRIYHFPPEGVVFIEDQLEWKRNEQGVLLTNQPKDIAPGGYDAQRVADLLCSDDVRGQKGFVILEGDPSTWDEQKAEARSKWLAFHEQQVEGTITSWEADCAGRRSQGLPMPTQKKAVVLAYAWRKRHRAALTRDPELLCSVCAYYASTATDLAGHIREEHPQLAAQLLGARMAAEPQGSATGPAPAPVAPRRAKPAYAPVPPSAAEDEEPSEEQEAAERDAMLAQSAPAPMEAALGNLAAPTKAPTRAEKVKVGMELLERAEKVGLEMSVADRKGLMKGDADVIEDVTIRVTAKVSRDEIKARKAADTAKQ